MASEILVNTGSGNVLLHDGTKLSPEPMLTYHIISKVLWHSSEDIIIWRFEDTNQWGKIEIYFVKSYFYLPGANEFKFVACSVPAYGQTRQLGRTPCSWPVAL